MKKNNNHFVPSVSWEAMEKKYKYFNHLRMLPVIKLIKDWGYNKKFYGSTSLAMLIISKFPYPEDLKHDYLTVETRKIEGGGVFNTEPPKKNFRIRYKKPDEPKPEIVLSKEFNDRGLEKTLKYFLEKFEKEGK